MSPDTDGPESPTGQIPAWVYGPVPDEVYTLFGKVVAIGAFLEDRLLQLLWALDDKPQHTHSGADASKLIELIEQGLKRIKDDGLRDRIKEALIDAKELIEIRHAAAHSLWPNPTLERMHGWRSKRGKQKTPADWIKWVELSGQQLREAIDGMVKLSEALDRLAQEVHSSPEIVKFKLYGATTS